jgi:hypothetical protein
MSGGKHLGIATAVGAAVGTGVGVAAGNVPRWIGLGAAAGLIGALFLRYRANRPLFVDPPYYHY